jgi:multidrug resistance protein
VDAEFGAHSHTKQESHPGYRLRNAHSRPSTAERGAEGVADRLEKFEEEDAQQRRDDQQVLADVQSGHSGESVLERQQAANNDEGAQSDRTTSDLGQVSSADIEAQSSTKEKHEEEEVEHHDDDLVTWDSEDSMENPRNWSLHRRWAVIAIVSSYTFLSPLSSSMIAPALQTISVQFHVTSTVEQSLMLSVFVLSYAIGPMLLGPLSEMFGRRVVLQTANAFFIIFTVACAVAQDRIQLSIFRFFAGLGGSAPLSIGGGTVSDLMNADERGTAMAMYSLGPLLGPAIGPMIGGWIIQQTGNWRWIFGVASIAAGVTASIGLFILPETYAPRILGKKAARLRKQTGNPRLHTIFDRKGTTLIQRLEHNMVRPFVLLGTQPVIMVLALYMMVMYGTMYLLLTTFESVFRNTYDESVGIASLNYISLAIGFTLGGQIGGRLIDRFYKALRAKNNGVGRPEFKLPVMMSTCWCLPVGLIIYGWSVEYKVHWIVPNIGAVILAVGMLTNFQSLQVGV